MSKTIATTTLSPFAFIPGAPILTERMRAVVEMQNHAAARRPILLFSINGLPHGAGGAPAGNAIVFDSGSWSTVARGTRYVPPDAQSILVLALAVFAASNAGEVRITVGAANVVLAVSDVADTDSDSLDTASTGTGFLAYTVEVRRTSGASSDNYLVACSGQTEVIAAADLPDPAND